MITLIEECRASNNMHPIVQNWMAIYYASEVTVCEVWFELLKNIYIIKLPM